MQDRLFRNPKIEVIWNHEIAEVLGRSEEGGHKSVTGIKIRDVTAGARADPGRTRLLRRHRPRPGDQLFKARSTSTRGLYPDRARFRPRPAAPAWFPAAM